jgi:hypothetical protein
MLATDTAGWITAFGTAFAAVGTVGAVIVALWQTKRRDVYKLRVVCKYGLTGDDTIGNLVTLQATNTGERLVKLTGAYLLSDDGRTVVAAFFQPGQPPSVLSSMEQGPLSASLVDGESVTVYWQESTLNAIKARDGFGRYLAAYFTDPLENTYFAPYPGMKERRTGLLRKGRGYVPRDN